MNRLLATAWANAVLMIIAAVLCKVDKDACRWAHATATSDVRRGTCDNDNALCCPPFPAHVSCACPMPHARSPRCRTAAWSCLVPSRDELAIGVVPLYYGSLVCLALGAFDHLIGR
jgi:hypothetical protein